MVSKMILRKVTVVKASSYHPIIFLDVQLSVDHCMSFISAPGPGVTTVTLY